MKLEDNGASDENGNAMPGGYCISDEASIYDYADYANCQLLLNYIASALAASSFLTPIFGCSDRNNSCLPPTVLGCN